MGAHKLPPMIFFFKKVTRIASRFKKYNLLKLSPILGGAYYLRPRLLPVGNLRPSKKDSKKFITYLHPKIPFEIAKLRPSTNKS
jgi:hypothetical protein